MYFTTNKQISLFEFGQKAGLKLNPDNRWIQMSGIIKWDTLETEYANRIYCMNNGAPAKPIRMAVGALLIKQIENLTDEKVVQHIQENPYMQYFCGIKEFTLDQPFTPSLMVEFRKRYDDGIMAEINDLLFRPEKPEKPDDDEDDSDPPNKGTLILDATCMPANIKYPQDIDLCNEAREKTESMIETMHAGNVGVKPKPRLDKEKARRLYLKTAKNKKRDAKTLRKTIKKQLSYIRRNLSYIDSLISDGHHGLLSPKQAVELETIRKLYEQQKHMIDHRTNTVPDRIVSISQPHVRPIVRGKAAAKTEFGAKVCVSVVDGYTFIENLSWNAYNEAGDLIGSVDYFKSVYGHYPEAVIVDKLFRNRENIEYCNERGIRISGPKLGRPPKHVPDADKRLAYEDSCTRNEVEGKIGTVKMAYGLKRVMAKLQETSESVICLAFLAMNIVKKFFLFRFFVFKVRIGSFYILSS